MFKKIVFVAGIVAPALFCLPAMAACPPSLHTFTNGFTADAVQVNDNFTNILNCESTLAPLNGPAFTGTASFAGATSFASTASFTGSVGIGTTSPTAPLSVVGNIRVFNSGSATAGGYIDIGGGTTGANIGYLGASGPLNGVGSDILIRATSNLLFYAGGGAEWMRITSSGNVGIGTTVPGYPLDVIGDIRTNTCLRYNGGGTPGGTCMSDILLKRDIVPFTLGLQSVIGLKPVNFYYNGLGGNPDDGVQQLGLIAQDVEKVVPQLVGTRLVKLHPSDTKLTTVKTVNYGALTAMLINAVKELKASNDRYAAQLAALQGRVADLERRTGIRTARLATHAAQ